MDRMIIDDVIKFIKISKEINPDIIERMKTAPFIKCQNVANYILQENEKEFFDLKTDFPNIAPPWNSYLVNWKFPKWTYSKEVGKIELPAEIDFEFLTLIIDASESTTNINKLSAIETSIEPFKEECKAKWMLNLMTFVKINENINLLGIGLLFIDKNGQAILSKDKEGKDVTPFIMSQSQKEGQEDILSIYIQSRLVAMMATCFCHCKNVDKKINYIPKPMVQKRSKDGKFPINKFYTLEIYPQAVKPKEGSKELGLWTNRFHICRGHFKHYTQESPLFGKYTGTIWVPMHTKGDKLKGEIKKDYKINI